jgi:hypothetical protein
MEKGTDRVNKSDKKESLKNYIENEFPIGLLCYDISEPFA